MQLVAFIIGAGPGVGAHVAKKLKDEGYTVAWGSRHPNEETVKKEGYVPFVVDVAKPDSIVKAFAAVRNQIGSPNVVVYNGEQRLGSTLMSLTTPSFYLYSTPSAGRSLLGPCCPIQQRRSNWRIGCIWGNPRSHRRVQVHSAFYSTSLYRNRERPAIRWTYGSIRLPPVPEKGCGLVH